MSRINLKRAVKSAERMQQLFAEGDEQGRRSMIESLWEMFNDESEIITGETEDKVFTRPKVSVKEKTMIASFFAREIAHKKRVEAAAGLTRVQTSERPHQTINITIEKLQALPAEQRALVESIFLDSVMSRASPGGSGV